MTVNPYVIMRDQYDDVCPQLEQRVDATERIRDSVKVLLYYNSNVTLEKNCGYGLWYHVANLNMTDPSEKCPSAWREYNTSGIRACGRPVTSSGSCPATTYSTGHPYSKVCGRIIGYQVASPDAFFTGITNPTINYFYVDGISITHGSPRKHIWTFVSGVQENNYLSTEMYACPCHNATNPKQPPSFVGNNYYCESANPSRSWSHGQIFTNDTLWDGEQCENEGSCCTTKSPPWFSVELSNPTTDDIEVRICGDESTSNEDTPIELLEIYVQ